jgi:hypothetical protein
MIVRCIQTEEEPLIARVRDHFVLHGEGLVRMVDIRATQQEKHSPISISLDFEQILNRMAISDWVQGAKLGTTN